VAAASTTRIGMSLVAAGALPFALAPAVHAADGLELACPFLLVTGAPCPLCGGTRAVALAASLDPDFLAYGAVWVVVLLALVVAGVLVLLGRRPALVRYPVTATAVAFAAGWAWALANRATITG
jgi:hypothetical protein